MRYYAINIASDASQSGTPFMFQSLQGYQLTSLLPTGLPNPAALNIVLDIPQYPHHSPAGNAFLQIWGLGLQDLGAAQNLNGKYIEIRAGMSRGLPLANPAQQGPLIAGKIWQAYGNWEGTKQTIDMQIIPDTGTPTDPKNFSFLWKSGTQLADALSNVFSTVYPNVPQNINISPNLVLNHDEAGVYGTLAQFSQMVNRLSKSIDTDPKYQGVQIAFVGQDIKATDGTVTPPAKYIAVQDLIGQPTWFQPNQITLKTVLRGDLDINDIIAIPPTIFGVQQAAQSQATITRQQDQLTFSGNFQVQYLHHHSDFRQNDAASWNTTIQAFMANSTPSGTGSVI